MGKAILVPGISFAQSNLGTVTPSSDVLATSVFISGEDEVFGLAEYAATFSPAWATERDVTWSILEGSQYASISSSGVLYVNSGVVSQNVKILCTYNSDPLITAEKTISCTSADIPFTRYDYLANSGKGRIDVTTPDLGDIYGAEVTCIGLITNSNGYLFGHRYAYPPSGGDSTNARFAAYRSNANRVACLIGSGDFLASGTTASSSVRYKWVFTLSTSASSSNASCKMYNYDTDTLLDTKSGYKCYYKHREGGSPDFGILSLNNENTCVGRFYEATIVKDGVTIADFVPGVANNRPCIKETVSGRLFFNETEFDTITAGNDE